MINRRELIRRGGAGAVALGLPWWAAGCGDEPPQPPPQDDEPPSEGETAADTDAGGAVVDTDTVLSEDTDDGDDTGAPLDSGDAGPAPVAFDASALPPDGSFPEAVRAGTPTVDGAVLITRTTGPGPVRLRVWAETPRAGEVVLWWDADAAPNDGGYVRVEVLGLPAGGVYGYGFFTTDAGGALTGRSDLGRFRTAPPVGDLAPLTVALMSCNGGATGPRDVMGRLADHPEVDLLVHVGDLAYNDGAFTRREFRESWQGWMTSEGYRRGLAATGMVATWDDHEIDNNWNPEAVDLQQFANGYGAMLENVPVRPGPQGQLWGTWRWGDTAEVFVLDCRGERQPSTRGRTDLYVSRAQMDATKAALLASTARFKLIVNSVPITGMPPIWDVAAADRWEGYPRQRDELLGFIADNGIEGAWFLSGDFHVCFVSRVDPGRAGPRGELREVAVTSGNVNPLGAVLNPPQFAYNAAQPRFCTLTCDPAADTLTVRFFDPANDRLIWERAYRRV